LDGFDPQIIDKSDPKNDRVEYEKNVVVYWSVNYSALEQLRSILHKKIR
jgi:hypothetical protein